MHTTAPKVPGRRRPPLAAVLAIVIVTVAVAALILAMNRNAACDEFKAEVDGYTRALMDAGVPEGEIAPRTSAALDERQPPGCDYI